METVTISTDTAAVAVEITTVSTDTVTVSKETAAISMETATVSTRSIRRAVALQAPSETQANAA